MSSFNKEADALGIMPVGRLLVRLAVPSILAQAVSLLYNIIDRIFIARISGEGSLALAGLGVTAPIITLLSAFANLVGMGGAPLCAIELGRGNVKRARAILWNSFLLVTAFSMLLAGGILTFKKPLLYLFGATENTIPFASAYISICAGCCLPGMLALALNAFLVTQGCNKENMLFVLAGTVLNIVLDPLFMYVMHWGIAGAAVATVISQTVSALCILGFLRGKRTVLRLLPSPIDVGILWHICSLGFATFSMTATEGAVVAVFNKQLAHYGNDIYIAAFSIIFTISQFVLTPVYGINQGGQPIISYSFGERKKERLVQAIRYILIADLTCSLITTLAIELFPETLLALFTSDQAVLAVGKNMLRIFVLGRAFSGLQWGVQTTFRAMGNALFPIIVMGIRKIVLIIPLAYFIPWLTGTGTTGVLLAEPISDFISVLCAMLIFIYFYRRTISVKNY